jgi:antibiotic biosynthesis monooxygenase (ABM) superfamily enzyme
MYGTVAKMEVQPGKREELKALMDSQMADPVPGYVKSYALMENDSDTLWITVLFEDKDSYMKNADDPAQHERYMAMRALLTADPEWHDGMIEEG